MRARGTDLALSLDTSAGTDTSVLNTAAAAVNAILHQLGPNHRVALAFGDLRGRAAEGSAGQLLAADARGAARRSRSHLARAPRRRAPGARPRQAHACLT